MLSSEVQDDVAHAANSADTNVQQLKAEFDELRTELRGRMSSLESAVVALQSDNSTGRLEVIKVARTPSERNTSKPQTGNSEKSQVSTGEVSEDEHSYQLQPSVWDTVLLLFMPNSPFSGIDDLIASTLFLINAVIQVLFSIIVTLQAWRLQNNLTGSEFQQDALVWRIAAGHHVNHYDPVTATSLATRVCADYGAEIISTWQQDVYHGIKEYMEGGEDVGFGTGHGPVISVVAVFIWTASCWIELLATWDFSLAILCAETGPTHLHRGVNSDGDKVYSLRSLSLHRKALVLLVEFARLGVALSLWFAGVLWLTYTVELNDIITNAVALGFVLEFDELLFQLGPKRISMVLSRMESLQSSLARTPKRWHADAKSIVALVIMGVAMVVWMLTSLTEFHRELAAAQSIFCGGDRSFTYTEDPALRVVSLATTTTDAEFRQNFSMQGSRPDVFRAVLQRTGLMQERDMPGILSPYVHELGAATQPFYVVKDDVEDIVKLSTQSVAEAINGVDCKNMDDTDATRAGMLAVLGETSCAIAQAVIGCDNTDVRIFCPLSCKCDSATSGIYLRSGCSQQCNPLVEEQSKKLVDQFYAQGDGCQDLTQVSHVDWYVTFFAEYEAELRQRGFLRSGGTAAAPRTTFSEFFLQSFSQRTDSLWRADSNVDVNVTNWLRRSLAAGWQCRFVLYFDKLFSTDVCTQSLTEGRGSVAAFCPRTCGLCSREAQTAVEIEWQVLARDFQDIGVKPVVSHMDEALEDAVAMDVCVRKGDAKGIFNGTTVGAADRVGQATTERLFSFWAKSSGTYTLQVRGFDGFDGYLSVWNGVTYEQMYANDNALGLDPCTKVDVQAGERFVVVVESAKANEEGVFELSVLCPWHVGEADARCPLNSVQQSRLGQPQTGTLSLQSAPCETLGLHPVFGAKCAEAAVLLQLRTSGNRSLATWAPTGCTYEEHGQVLFIDGAGTAECGDTYKCICSSVPQEDLLFSKACVEFVDPHCSNGLWDAACNDVCESICSSVCDTAPFIIEGPCALTSNVSAQEWCISSPDFPLSYGTLETCTIALSQDAAKRYGPLRASYFYVDHLGTDYFEVNGIQYWGDSLQINIVPSTTMVWSSDGYDGSGTIDAGWRICSTVETDPCSSTAGNATNSLGQDCDHLAKHSLFCDTAYDTEDFSVREMCCHCGGGVFDSTCSEHVRLTDANECNEGTWPDVLRATTCGDCKALIDGFGSEYSSCQNYCEILGLQCLHAWQDANGDCEVQNEVPCAAMPDRTAICECVPEVGPRCDEIAWPDRKWGYFTCGNCKVLVEQFMQKYDTCTNYCATVGRTCVGAWEDLANTCDTMFAFGCDEAFGTTDAICECSPEVTVNRTNLCDEESWPDKDDGQVCGDCSVLVDLFNSKYKTCDAYCASLGRTCVAAAEEDAETCKALYAMECNRTLNSVDAICTCSPQRLANYTDLCDELHWPGSIRGIVCGDCKVLVGSFPVAYKTCGEYCMTMGRSCLGGWADHSETCKEEYEIGCDNEPGQGTAICECSSEQVFQNATVETSIVVPVGRSPTLTKKCVNCVGTSGLRCTVDAANSLNVPYTFNITVSGNELCATVTDNDVGWDYNLYVVCKRP